MTKNIWIAAAIIVLIFSAMLPAAEAGAKSSTGATKNVKNEITKGTGDVPTSSEFINATQLSDATSATLKTAQTELATKASKDDLNATRNTLANKLNDTQAELAEKASKDDLNRTRDEILSKLPCNTAEDNSTAAPMVVNTINVGDVTAMHDELNKTQETLKEKANTSDLAEKVSKADLEAAKNELRVEMKQPAIQSAPIVLVNITNPVNQTAPAVISTPDAKKPAPTTTNVTIAGKAALNGFVPTNTSNIYVAPGGELSWSSTGGSVVGKNPTSAKAIVGDTESNDTQVYVQPTDSSSEKSEEKEVINYRTITSFSEFTPNMSLAKWLNDFIVNQDGEGPATSMRRWQTKAIYGVEVFTQVPEKYGGGSFDDAVAIYQSRNYLQN